VPKLSGFYVLCSYVITVPSGNLNSQGRWVEVVMWSWNFQDYLVCMNLLLKEFFTAPSLPPNQFWLFSNVKDSILRSQYQSIKNWEDLLKCFRIWVYWWPIHTGTDGDYVARWGIFNALKFSAN
jgi:hypothetical protein